MWTIGAEVSWRMYKIMKSVHVGWTSLVPVNQWTVATASNCIFKRHFLCVCDVCVFVFRVCASCPLAADILVIANLQCHCLEHRRQVGSQPAVTQCQCCRKHWNCLIIYLSIWLYVNKIVWFGWILHSSFICCSLFCEQGTTCIIGDKLSRGCT